MSRPKRFAPRTVPTWTAGLGAALAALTLAAVAHHGDDRSPCDRARAAAAASRPAPPLRPLDGRPLVLTMHSPTAADLEMLHACYLPAFAQER